MDRGSRHHTGGSDQDHLQEKEVQKGKMVVQGGLTNNRERKDMKGKGEKERYTHLNAEFQRLARRAKKAVLSDQCKEIEENNRMGNTRDHLGRLSYLSLLFFGTLHSDGYIFPFLLCLCFSPFLSYL